MAYATLSGIPIDPKDLWDNDDQSFPLWLEVVIEKIARLKKS
jgi:hypothetical protein